VNLFAISYYAPPRLTPQAIQIGRLLYHLDAQVELLHGDDPQFSNDYDQYPDFFQRVRPLRIPSPGPLLPDLAHRAARRLLPLYGAVPDGLGPWRRLALPHALKALRERRPDALLSFGMPMSDHLLALDVRRRTGLPWLAHFSDPWSDNIFHPSGWLAQRANEALERQVVAGADVLLFTSDRTLDLVMRKYPSSWRARAGVLPHAWDMDHFAGDATSDKRAAVAALAQSDAQAATAAAAQDPVYAMRNALTQTADTHRPGAAPAQGRRPGGAPSHIVRYIGACYGTRSPAPLFAALAGIHATDAAALADVHVELVGHVSPGLLDTPALRALPPDLLSVRSPVAYRHSLELARSADALLVIDAPSPEPSVFLPSKLVEYIGARRPVWGITPPGTAADLIAEWAGHAEACAPPDQPAAVDRMLRSGLASLAAGTVWAGPETVRQRFAAPRVAAALKRYVQQAIAHAALRSAA